MTLFWRSCAAGFAGVAGLLLAGCFSRTWEGAWRGALPLDQASDCRIRLYARGTFDVSCPAGGWVMAGRYDINGSRMVMTFLDPVMRKEQRVMEFAPIELEVDHRGNEITVTGRNFSSVWRRFKPRGEGMKSD